LKRQARHRAPQPASFPSLAGAAAGQSAQRLPRSCGGCQELSWRSRGLLQLCWASCCFSFLGRPRASCCAPPQLPPGREEQAACSWALRLGSCAEAGQAAGREAARELLGSLEQQESLEPLLLQEQSPQAAALLPAPRGSWEASRPWRAAWELLRALELARKLGGPGAAAARHGQGQGRGAAEVAREPPGARARRGPCLLASFLRHSLSPASQCPKLPCRGSCCACLAPWQSGCAAALAAAAGELAALARVPGLLSGGASRRSPSAACRQARRAG